MSGSRKRTPISGITTARSEKQDKRIYNRRLRHSIKQILRVEPEREVLPHLYSYSNPRRMPKDGRFRFDPSLYPKLMRK